PGDNSLECIAQAGVDTAASGQERSAASAMAEHAAACGVPPPPERSLSTAWPRTDPALPATPITHHLALAITPDCPPRVPPDEGNDNFPARQSGHPGSPDDNKPARR